MAEGIVERDLLLEPSELIKWTRICRMCWQGFLRRRRNGITEEMRVELSAMNDLISRLVSEEPVKVENHAIVYDPSKMEQNKIYAVEVLGRLHLVRKTEENVVETYELEAID